MLAYGGAGQAESRRKGCVRRMRVWVDGRLVEDPYAPALAPLDHGVTVGDGVFETLKVVDGRPFALTRHLDRLARSAHGLGLTGLDLAAVRRGVSAVLEAWDRPGGRLRITVTGGPAPLGSERGDQGLTVMVAIAELSARPDSTALVTVPWPRNERGALAGLKTTSYAENVVALAHARQHGATEALFANTVGNVCEGTGSNVFVVLGGEVYTPPLSAGCLAGVTRALVLEWCGGYEKDLPASALEEAEELFLTSTTRDVQAVNSLDGRKLPAPGPVTARVMEEFARAAADRIDP
ncbi:branched-chain amino acid aminotransferase [Actinopolymorpha singaporensis]|uniref:aminodeoxychorismate lyase n=2 Tax=Actinopolymorpha singaporensis TaxID=117157 RepID=A0A1H1VGE5_9ACTN|nr:branched-chain amino acid aminotransferase [Actinopolymorpha singaporensis]